MNFGPRAGLAWDPHGDGRDSFRIGGATGAADIERAVRAAGDRVAAPAGDSP